MEVNLRGAAEGVRVEAIVYDEGHEIVTGMNRRRRALVLSIRIPSRGARDPHLYDLKVRLSRRAGRRRGRQLLRHAQVRARAGRAGICASSSTTSRCSCTARSTRATSPTGCTPRRPTLPCASTSSTPKRLGCNLIRKHVKVEPARWYAALRPAGDDRLAGHAQRRQAGRRRDLRAGDPGRLEPGRHAAGWAAAGRGDEANRSQFRAELKGMVDTCTTRPASPPGCRSTRAGASSRRPRSASG